ncbi:hypothetical protein GSUB_17245 (plasmid) [Geoalkalibacter subterraneus]|uniref:Uncharacterized protein n=1 Tax=Geoalkalibacter subterraneus TaxID=483547 RepID=A0A0B5FXA9_9BACT|nr:hypothetical protein GSUB_17245 [Geoalkalibacter subterraneus]
MLETAHSSCSVVLGGTEFWALRNDLGAVTLAATKQLKSSGKIKLCASQTTRQKLLLFPEDRCTCSAQKELANIKPFARHIADIDFQQLHTPLPRYLWVKGPCIHCSKTIVTGIEITRRATGSSLIDIVRRKFSQKDPSPQADPQRVERLFAFYQNSLFWQYGDALASGHLNVDNPLGVWF